MTPRHRLAGCSWLYSWGLRKRALGEPVIQGRVGLRAHVKPPDSCHRECVPVERDKAEPTPKKCLCLLRRNMNDQEEWPVRQKENQRIRRYTTARNRGFLLYMVRTGLGSQHNGEEGPEMSRVPLLPTRTDPPPSASDGTFVTSDKPTLTQGHPMLRFTRCRILWGRAAVSHGVSIAVGHTDYFSLCACIGIALPPSSSSDNA